MIDRRAFLKFAGCCTVAAMEAGLRPDLAGAAAAGRPSSVSRPEWARKRFLTHWNCTQAMFETYCDGYGLSQDMAVKIAAPFAAGMAQGRLCGAVTGAYLVLGLARGGSQVDDVHANEPVYDQVKLMTKALEEKFGDLSCSALMGTDMGTPEGIREAAAKGLFTSKCPVLMEQTAMQLERLLAS